LRAGATLLNLARMSRIGASTAKHDAFADLNDAQRAAVEHGDAPLLVIAGAGSGKTKTLSCRVAHLLQRGADPNRILLLTFSRRAAAEMGRRVAATTASENHLPWAGTFHAVGARLLRELTAVTGLQPDFTIHDRSDSADLMGMARHELGLGAGAQRFPMKGRAFRSIRARSTPTKRWWTRSRRRSRGAAPGKRI
jgi:DNA helicase-2/ATP-dependent DNA helicase PcrA